MKHKGKNKKNMVIIALIAICCLGAGCKKSEETTTKQTSKASETEATTIQTTEETSSETTEQSSETEKQETSASEEETTATTEASAATEAPASETIALGAGNITNHGFATGNSLYSFYVTHSSSDKEALTQENASGEKKELYSASSIDYLNLQGETLYFRDGRNAISKLNIADGSCEKIYEGEITNLTLSGDHLYFSENSSLVRCGLDGSNKEVLFEEQHSAMPADVAFCITNDKIYFSDPTDFATGGSFFGKVYFMDLDGKNRTDFPSGIVACNAEMFFSDGKCLYFYGSSEDQSVSGYLRINLDGSDLRHVNRNSPTSVNTVDGKEYMGVSEGLDLLDAELTPTPILETSIGASARFAIVGENIYFMNATGKTMRVSLDGTNVVELG